jgi:hypothetical protein
LILFGVSILCLLNLPLSHFEALTAPSTPDFLAIFQVLLFLLFLMSWFCLERKVYCPFSLQSLTWHKNSSIQKTFNTCILIIAILKKQNKLETKIFGVGPVYVQGRHEYIQSWSREV